MFYCFVFCNKANRTEIIKDLALMSSFTKSCSCLFFCFKTIQTHGMLMVSVAKLNTSRGQWETQHQADLAVCHMMTGVL